MIFPAISRKPCRFGGGMPLLVIINPGFLFLRHLLTPILTPPVLPRGATFLGTRKRDRFIVFDHLAGHFHPVVVMIGGPLPNRLARHNIWTYHLCHPPTHPPAVMSGINALIHHIARAPRISPGRSPLYLCYHHNTDLPKKLPLFFHSIINQAEHAHREAIQRIILQLVNATFFVV